MILAEDILNDLVPIPYVYFPNGNYKYPFVGIDVIRVTLSNGDVHDIPLGMRSDLSSSPQILWGILPPYGKFLLAAIIHDYLYIFDCYRKQMGDKAARKFIDKEMLIWSNKLSDNKFDNYVRYYGVRLFGTGVFNRWNSGKMIELQELNKHLCEH